VGCKVGAVVGEIVNCTPPGVGVGCIVGAVMGEIVGCTPHRPQVFLHLDMKRL
jgi:uncharacterized membrane protein